MSLKFQPVDPSDEVPQENDDSTVSAAYPWFSIGLIVCYAAVFAAQAAVGFDRSILLAGDDKQAVLRGHEFWRLLTGAALHGGLLHFAMNSYAFYSFGSTFEMLTSRWHVPIVFVIGAAAGSLLSLLVNPQGVSVGASGGIIGLVGYLLVYSFKRRQFIAPEFRRSLIINIGIILLYGFLLAGNIDNAAHLGGMVSGAAYALVQVPSDPTIDPRTASKATEGMGVVSGAIYIVTCIFAVLVIVGVI